MKQADINREVARATGESVATVKRLGFLIADPDEPIGDPNAPELGGRVIDWDDFDCFRTDHDAEPLDAFATC